MGWAGRASSGLRPCRGWGFCPPETSSSAGEGEEGGAGRIPDANRPLLISALFERRNSRPIDLGIVGDDDVASVASALRSAFEDEGCDVVITTGGISVGEKDVMERALTEEMGAEIRFGRLRMKPGKPASFFTLDVPSSVDGPTTAADNRGVAKASARTMRRVLVFCLPGNPVSAAVCAQLLVQPCLDLLHSGAAAVSAARGRAARIVGGGVEENGDDGDDPTPPPRSSSRR